MLEVAPSGEWHEKHVAAKSVWSPLYSENDNLENDKEIIKQRLILL